MNSRLKKPTHIFDYFVEVSRPKPDEEATLTYIYPKEPELGADTKKQLPKFAFPTRTQNEKEEHFTFVLTDLDGKYKFGFCRHPPKAETCMCFLSDVPWYKVFYRAMDKISAFKLDHQNEIVEPFLSGLYSHPIPTPGIDSVLSVVPEGVDTGQVYTFPLPTPKRLPEIPTDDNLTQFYTNLHYNVILHLFANMVFERRIIITSSSTSLLSSTVHGAVLLLYPLFWQHIFIPITPPHLLDYCAAPMPFLMGIHSSFMDVVRKMPLDDVVILDVDESTIESPHCEDLGLLPPEVVSNLKHILKRQSSAYGDTVARSFLLAQVAMIGGYRSALKFRQGEKEVVFDEEQFLKSRPNGEEFLGQLLHFQHFRQFINGKIDKLKNKSQERDLFDSEVLTYEEDITSSEQVKAAFDKFVSSTVEGSKKLSDRIKEGSGKLGGKLQKQAKIVDKGWKNMMKGAKRMMTEPKPPPGYEGHVIEHAGLIHGSEYLTDRKYHSLPMSHHGVPMHHSASESMLTQYHRAIPTLYGPGSKTSRHPPPVIPYHRHVEGKRRLAESLRLQSTSSAPEVPTGMLLSFTPPDTPSRGAANADQSSLDHSERASLDSKDSTEASVASGEVAAGEVAVGDLVDLTSSSPTGEGDKADKADKEVHDEDGNESDTSSTVSTTSSSGVTTDGDPTRNWERFDEEQQEESTGVPDIVMRPPLPPPRSELDKLEPPHPPVAPSTPSKNPFQEFDIESDDGTAPPPPPPRPRSPFEDFSSSIAQTLFDNSQKLAGDSLAANTFANTSKELFKTIEENEEKVASTGDAEVVVNSIPLIPTSSTAMVTSNDTTAIIRGSQLQNHRATPPLLHSSSSTPDLIPPHTISAPQPVATQNAPPNPFYTGPFTNSSPNFPLVRRPAGPRSPKFAQRLDQFTQQQQEQIVVNSSPKNWRQNHTAGQQPPPLKPAPYTGGAMSLYHSRQPPQDRQQLQALYSNPPLQSQNNNNNSSVIGDNVAQQQQLQLNGVCGAEREESLSPLMLQRLPSIGEFNPLKDFFKEDRVS